jgi:DNA repair exonuclease SbcCD ATPase subunit
MSSTGYLTVGQSTSLKVEKAPMNTPSTFGINSGFTSSPLTQTPITITSGSNGLSSGQRLSSGGIISSPSYTGNQQYTQTYSGQTGTTTPKVGKSAKDYLLSNDLEARAETQHMRKSQQVVLPSSISGGTESTSTFGGKFDTRLTNPSRQDVFQSSYVPRDTVGRDTFGSNGGFNPNQGMNFNNFQYIAELEKNMAELRMEYNNMKRTGMHNERQLNQYSKELEYLQDENGRLRTDLHKMEHLKAQFDEVSLELERMKADRDFHNEQHLNLRKELLEIVKQEYELDSIRREKVFIEGELKNYKEKSLIYEKQIDELTILAKRPVSKTVNDGSDKQEHYYAKKILELETKLKEFKKANDELRHENNSYKAGIKNNLDESRINEAGFRATTPDSLLEQVNLLKKKNESLKKENEIIRRELKSSGGSGELPKFGGSSDTNADSRIKELQKQIETLTRKNMKLEEDALLGGMGGGSLEAMELKVKLDEANRQIAKLKSGASSGSFMVEGRGASSYDEKLQKMVSDLLEQVNTLKQEKEELMHSGGGGGGADPRVSRLMHENSELKTERDRLKYKVQELQNQLEQKTKELEILRSSGSVGADSEALAKVLETNARLHAEIAKLQEKMRIMDSMNMSVTQGGGNNSMLTPYSQFMMP